MTKCAGILRDAFFAFFGFVTGRDFGYAPGYAVLGGALLLGALLLLFLLASLLARHAKMPLPPEERGHNAQDAEGTDTGDGNLEEQDARTKEGDREKQGDRADTDDR